MQRRPPPLARADTIRLAAVPTAVSCARAFVRRALRHWQLPAVHDNAELITSELVTNAVLATGTADPNPTYAMLANVSVLVLRLSVVGSCLRIEVWDNSPKLPERQVRSEDSEGGRGLLLVEALSFRHGAIPAPDGIGKVVWADLALDGTSPTDRKSKPLSPLPQREARSRSASARSYGPAADPALLERVLLGLRRLGREAEGSVRAVDGSPFSA
jgi:anti-sigma regulatory factor (Ser/Thr protein kinase)